MTQLATPCCRKHCKACEAGKYIENAGSSFCKNCKHGELGHHIRVVLLGARVDIKLAATNEVELLSPAGDVLASIQGSKTDVASRLLAEIDARLMTV